MKITTIEKGTPYSQAEMDIRATLNGFLGDKLLDGCNCFFEDTEIHFIVKRKQEM